MQVSNFEPFFRFDSVKVCPQAPLTTTNFKMASHPHKLLEGKVNKRIFFFTLKKYKFQNKLLERKGQQANIFFLNLIF